MTPIRVLLADDHTLVRAGIRGLLQGLPGVEVVGEAGDGHEALRLAETLRPDVVLLDVGMPGLNGLEVAARLATRSTPRSACVILSMHTSEEYVLRALRAGCVGLSPQGLGRRGAGGRRAGRRPRRDVPESGGLEARGRRLRRAAPAAPSIRSTR